jgi:hypothetical protein
MEKRTFQWELDVDVLRYFKFQLTKRKMAKWISKLRFSMAKKRFTAEPYKARKCIFHGLRFINFASQIVLSGTILDYSAGNYLLPKVMEFKATSWNELKGFFEPIYDQLLKDFEALVPFAEFYSHFEMIPKIPARFLQINNLTIKYSKRFSHNSQEGI